MSDEHFLAVAAKAKSIKGLLAEFFGFLHRRTDFYIVDRRPDRPMGFDAGAAEAILLETFRSLPFRDPDGRPMEKKSAASSTVSKTVQSSSAAGGAVTQKKAAEEKKVQAAAKPEATKDAAGASVKTSEPAASAPATAPASEAAKKVVATTSAPSPAAAAAAGAAHRPTLHYTAAGKQVPIGNGGVGRGYWWTQSLKDTSIYLELPEQVTGKALKVTLLNSRITVQYTPPPPPKEAGAGAVAQGGEAPPAATATAGPFSSPSAAPITVLDVAPGGSYAPSESMWVLEAAAAATPGGSSSLKPFDPLYEGQELPAFRQILQAHGHSGSGSGSESVSCKTKRKTLLLVLDKAPETWWWSAFKTLPAAVTAASLAPANFSAASSADHPTSSSATSSSASPADLLEDHPCIDATLVDSTQTVDSYDPETQAAIRKVLFDQAQKARGLPTSDEMEKQRLLEMAMAAPGAPTGL